MQRRTPPEETILVPPDPTRQPNPWRDRLAHERPVLLAWVLFAALSNAPYLRAAFAAPPGTTFTGFFQYQDDHFNYLSYAQQTEQGRFLFLNKMVPEPHAPALVNIEWWVVGQISRALGQHPAIAYRVLGAFVALGFLLACDRWLRDLGLPTTHRLPALVLVTTGGGLGGLLFETTPLASVRCLDLYAGLFPYLGFLNNVHFLTGTTLLLWSLRLFWRARGAPGLVAAIITGSVLGLVRPYDFVLLAVGRVVAIVAGSSPRGWVRSLLPLVGLAPVAAYNGWLIYGNPDFSSLGQIRYYAPPLLDFVPAIAPACVLAAGALLRRPGPSGARLAWTHAIAWVGVVGLIVIVRPVPFWLQFIVGVGTPLLLLGALTLSRFAPRITLLACIPMALTAAVAMKLTLSENPAWFVPSERLAVASVIRRFCQPGQLVLAPADIGLYVAGLTACTPYVSHAGAPHFGARVDRVSAFYAPAPAADRAAILADLDIQYAILPGDRGERPVDWLGESTPFRRLAVVSRGKWRIGIYGRPDPRPSVPDSSPVTP